MAILEMKHISKSFNSSLVNDGIDFSVEPGEIHALLGENGAGKTTLMNILFGIYTMDQGEIIWKNRPASFKSPREAIANGIGMVHQHFSLVRSMTVLDNIILGLKSEGLFIRRNLLENDIRELSSKYGLTIDPKARISGLSVGEQQRVEILKALYRKIELLILDEPTGVLTPEETKNFFGVLRRLKAEGYAVILITHKMNEIMEISDRVTVIRDGKKVGTLLTAETSPDELSYRMIGREVAKAFDIPNQPQGEEILKLDRINLKKPGEKAKLKDISLSVHQGEILGIAGVDGNGQKELAEVLAGIRPHTSGDILFRGKTINHCRVKERFAEGISYISDDRHDDGLVLQMSVMENLVLREFREKPYSKHRILNQGEIRKSAEAAIQDYRIKTSGVDPAGTTVKDMSGGNQQKVIIAREVPPSARLVIANQPTRGLDIGATEFVRQTLLDKRNAQHSVILISADLEEILAISDRIAVMFEGRIMGILKRDEADIQKIGLYMGGITGEA